MIRQIFQTAILVFFLAEMLSSCDPCDNRECLPDEDGRFRIVAADRRDLLFGPFRKYDHSQIRFYSIIGKDTTYFNSRGGTSSPTVTVDSILYVFFSPMPDTAYMRLSDGDIDTITIKSVRLDGGKCCPDVTDIISMQHNGKDIQGITMIK